MVCVREKERESDKEKGDKETFQQEQCDFCALIKTFFLLHSFLYEDFLFWFWFLCKEIR